MDKVAGQQTCSACSMLRAYVVDDEVWHQKRCGMTDRENLMRIHIIGGPGSGKTTLARELGAILGIEVHELDQIAFTDPDYAFRPLGQRLADVHLIAQETTWITEGFFILWIDELLACADIIVWLDHVGWSKSFWRITRRYVTLALQETKKRRGLAKVTRFRDYARHLGQLIQVLFSSRAYYRSNLSGSDGRIENRRSTAAHLSAYREKIIHCYNDDAVEAFLGYIHCSQH